MKLRYYLTISLLFIFALSNCSKDDPVEKTIEPQVLKYVYTGIHELKDFQVYVGPYGEQLPFDVEKAAHFWNESSRLGSPYYDTLIIDLKKDSLYMKTAYATLGEVLKLAQDTLKTEPNDTGYYGVFVGDSIFRMNRAHYFMHYEGRETDWNPYSNIGYTGIWRNHEEAKTNEFFHENSRYRNHQDMTLPSDTIACLTEYYEFKLVDSF